MPNATVNCLCNDTKGKKKINFTRLTGRAAASHTKGAPRTLGKGRELAFIKSVITKNDNLSL